MGNTSRMWTGNACRSAATFCYYYADVDSQDSTIEQVSGVINDLYGPGCAGNPASSTSSAATPSPSVSLNNNGTRLGIAPRFARRPVSRDVAKLAQTVHNLVTDDGDVRDYVVNIEINVLAMGDSATLFLFDGPVDGDVNNWRTCASYLGKRTFLTSSSMGSQKQSRRKTGAISLNNALISRVRERKLGGMGNAEVSVYLKKNMHWKVVKVCRTPLRARNHLLWGDN